MRQFLRSFSDIRKFIRRGSPKDVVKVCPICLTNNLEVIPNSFLGLLSPPYYLCRNCGYKGAIFAEIDQKQYESLDLVADTNSSSGG
ncbi:MAG: hypothetical protein ACFFB5_02690 [Promethearchaeota archaeon]